MSLILSLLAAMLLMVLGSALVMATMAETRIAAAYQRAAEALYAADGAGELAMQELAAVADWSDALDGSERSTFVDGPPSGTRALPGGGVLDLAVMSNFIRCGKPTTCSAADMDATTSDRPWGANNPRWELFAYGRLDMLAVDPPLRSPVYIVAWVGDDPAEHDNLPLVDGDPNIDGSVNKGADVAVLLVHAYGAAGARRVLELTVARESSGLIRLASWREIRQ